MFTLVDVIVIAAAFELAYITRVRMELAHNFFLAPERREPLLSGRLKRYTAATLADKAALQSELHDIENSGFAFDMEEHSVGICAVGVAFLDPAGRAYSISIPVPASRFAERRQQLCKLLKKTSGELLTALGVPAQDR